MNRGYFSSERDTAIINDGGFFCHACLVGRPALELSPDMRYCRGCYDLLVQETSRVSAAKRPPWIPKDETDVEPSQKPCPLPEDVSIEKVGFVTASIGVGGSKKNVGGRPRKTIPSQLVLALGDQGLSTREIARELPKRGHEPVSYQTVARVLANER